MRLTEREDGTTHRHLLDEALAEAKEFDTLEEMKARNDWVTTIA